MLGVLIVKVITQRKEIKNLKILPILYQVGKVPEELTYELLNEYYMYIQSCNPEEMNEFYNCATNTISNNIKSTHVFVDVLHIFYGWNGTKNIHPLLGIHKDIMRNTKEHMYLLAKNYLEEVKTDVDLSRLESEFLRDCFTEYELYNYYYRDILNKKNIVVRLPKPDHKSSQISPPNARES